MAKCEKFQTPIPPPPAQYVLTLNEAERGHLISFIASGGYWPGVKELGGYTLNQILAVLRDA